MDTCLIACLDYSANVGNSCSHALDNGILGLPGCVCVKIEDIVVLNAVLRRAPGEDVPRCLKQRSRDEPSVGEAELRKTLKQDLIYSIPQHCLDQIPLVHEGIPDISGEGCSVRVP